MFDKLFKVSVLFFLFALLLLAWRVRDTGRYAMLTANDYSLLDTRTGTLYDMSKGGLENLDGAVSVERHPQTGELSVHYA